MQVFEVIASLYAMGVNMTIPLIVIAIELLIIIYLSYQVYQLKRNSQIQAEMHRLMAVDYREQEQFLSHELQHRVKNNLQIITGLLQMQIDTTSSVDESDFLTTYKNRLETIHLLYHQLGKEGRTMGVNSEEYFKVLVATFQNNFFRNTQLVVGENKKKIILSLDQATPLGLIVYECFQLIASFEFKRRETNLLISLLKKGVWIEFKMELKEKNYACNLDRQEQNTLNWLIINGLASQLGGVIQNNKLGEVVTLRFPMLMPN